MVENKMTVTDIKVLRETENYIITLCKVEVFDDPSILERLDLKLDGKLIFVQNHYHFQKDEDFEQYSEALSKAKTFKKSQGWFRNYGQGSPLDQFKDNFSFRLSKDYSSIIEDFGKLTEFTEIHKQGSIWKFHGNHKTISSAFSFIIWNKELAKKIHAELKQREEMRVKN